MISRRQIKTNVRRLVNRKASGKTLRRLRYWRGVNERLTDHNLRAIMRAF